MDLIHQPTLNEGEWACSDCEAPLPPDVCVGDAVVELGGAGIHFLPAFAHSGPTKVCTKGKAGEAVIVCPACGGEGCGECDRGITSSKGVKLEIKQAKLTNGEKVERLPKKSEFEKQMQRASINAFVAMKEATRPDGT